MPARPLDDPCRDGPAVGKGEVVGEVGRLGGQVGGGLVGACALPVLQARGVCPRAQVGSHVFGVSFQDVVGLLVQVPAVGFGVDQVELVGCAAEQDDPVMAVDNAMAEALNGTFKAELIEMQGPWKDVDQVERAVFQWITWYHEERLHSALDYVPPAEYEAAYYRTQQSPTTGAGLN